MSYRHAGNDWNVQWTESLTQDVTERPTCVVGGLATVERTQGNAAHSVESSCAHQLSDHAVDSVWGLTHILEKQDLVFGTQRPFRTGEAGQHTEVTADDLALDGLRVSTEPLSWEVLDGPARHPVSKRAT